MKIFNRKRILILSPESWDHLPLSKHHYAIVLASLGNEVFFLNPPSDKNACTASPYTGLFILDYKPVVKGLNRLPSFLAQFFWKWEIKRLRKLARTRFDIVWSFDPYRFQDLSLFGAATRIYYAADWHQNKRLERALADTANYILSPSSLVLQGIITRGNKAKVSHGVASHFFEKATRYTLPGKHAIKAGYVGNLVIKSLDKELVWKTVHENPDIDFAFAGSAEAVRHDATWEKIFKLDNAHSVGTLPNEQVPAFLTSCDVLLLFYNTVQFRREASNSHKILEYLSSGRVVVSTPMEEYKEQGALLCMPASYEGFSDLFKTVVQDLEKYNSLDLQKRRRDFAVTKSYPTILSEIDNMISRVTD